MSEKDTLILAIESSCDETAASVVKNGRCVLSNIISSQIAIHTLYGGVVPEIASRKHIEKINQVVEAALKEADVTLDDIDAIGVTYGLVLSAHFSSAWQRQKRSPMQKRNRWSAFTILKATSRRTISNTRIWSRRSCVKSSPEAIPILSL